MVPRLAALLLLLPSLALAQTTTAAGTVTISESNDTDAVVSLSECSGARADNLSFSWTLSSAATSGTSLNLYAADRTGCVTTGNNDTVNTYLVGSSTSNGIPNSVSAATIISAVKIACSTSTTLYFCVFNGGPGSTLLSSGTINIDAAVPPAPVVNDPSPGDGALNVSWTNGTTVADGGTVGTATSYEVFVTPHGSAFPANSSTTVTSPATSARVNNLTNGASYDLVVYAFSQGGNQSAASNIVSGTPVPVDDFWTSYKSAGGRESGGCSSGAAGAIALALAPLLLLARKRRRS